MELDELLFYLISCQTIVQLYIVLLTVQHRSSYQNINRIFILCKITCYTISFIAYRFTERIYRSIILPVVLYGVETWSLTLRVKGRLRVFENMVLRRVFGPKRDEERGEWRRLHRRELNDL